MCGIIGLISTGNIKRKVIQELYKLEYRGYDSAGISLLAKESIETTKQIGSIKNLEKSLDYEDDQYTTAIAHTRWATHGKANLLNCHPHLSQDKQWAVVHNGIIENYTQLKDQLTSKNIKLKSQTDSEVIPNLLSLYQGENPIQNLIEVCNMLQGSYALACICPKYQDNMFVARKDSPLYIAKTNQGVIVSSDIVSFIDKTESYYVLKNFEFAHIIKQDIIFYDSNCKKIIKTPLKLNNIDKNSSMESFNHFMIKEIYEVPSLLKDVSNYYINNKELINDFKNILKNCDQIRFVGCGTAFHSGLIGEKFFNKFLNVKVSSHIASEFNYDNISIDNKTICIFISQSGETADTISALKYAKSKGATCIALTNNTNSQITFISDYTWPILAGVEIAVASTKAYNCQCLCLYLVAYLVAERDASPIVGQIEKLSIQLQNVDVLQIMNLAEKVKKYKNVFFIGRNLDYVTSLESSLKLKEITYINSVACQSGELKHGTLALIDKNSLVITTITQPKLKQKCTNAIFEIKARGAKMIVMSQFKEIKDILLPNDVFIDLTEVEDDFVYQLAICYMQLLAYYVSVKKGINPDKPRNLAKSVTVE